MMNNFKLGEEDFTTTKGIILNGIPVKSISGDSDSITIEATLDSDVLVNRFNPYPSPLNLNDMYVEKKKEKLPKRYIINKGATILFWDEDEEEKTIVKRSKDDKFNKRLGFLTAYFQYHSGLSKTQANKYLDSLEVEKEK